MNCHPLGAYILPKMAHTHQAFETIGRVLAALINGSHIRGETSVWACERPPSFPPRMAFSSSRAIGVVVLHGTSFCRQSISHAGDSNHADFMFCFFQMSSLPRRAKVRVQTAESKDEFSSLSEL